MPADSAGGVLEKIRGVPTFGPVGYIVSLKEGIPSFIDREIEGLRRLGCEIQLYTTQRGRGLYAPRLPSVYPSIGRLIAGNLFFMFTRPRRFIRSLLVSMRGNTLTEFGVACAFGRVLKKRKTRLIHCTFGDRKLYIGFHASRLTGIPLTVMIHSHELTFYLEKPAFGEALRSCSRILTVCDYNRMVLTNKYPELQDRILVARLFVDPGLFKMDSRIKVLTVAKFHDYKGYNILAEAARKLRDKSIVFWIVGDGPIDVEELIRREGATGNVILLSSVSERVLMILYQTCDIFCLPSRTAPSGQKEGLPVSLMEAMSFAKPVVSTRHAGIPELVPSVLVEEGDSSGLAEAILAYAIDPGKRMRDGERNRRIVLERFSPKNLDLIRNAFHEISEE